MKKLLGIMSVLALTLAACAPSATSAAGTTANTPRAPLKLAAGQTVTASLEFNPETLAVDDSEDKQLDVDFTQRDSLDRVSDHEIPVSWFGLTGVVPASWQAKVDNAFYGYHILRTDTTSPRTSVRYLLYVRFVVELTAPAQVDVGPTTVGLKFKNSNGQSATVPVYVNIAK